MSRNARLWEAVNKPFVLWALSSLFLGFFGWAFAGFEASREADRAKAEIARKLDTEIAGRLQEASSALVRFEVTARDAMVMKHQGELFDESTIWSAIVRAIDATTSTGSESSILNFETARSLHWLQNSAPSPIARA